MRAIAAHSALTAQPTLELHLHGSPALMQLLLKLLPTLSPSFRIAEPGEFTRLAFEAGKMDLTEVEGIRDLVEADTEAQRKLAARQANVRPLLSRTSFWQLRGMRTWTGPNEAGVRYDAKYGDRSDCAHRSAH